MPKTELNMDNQAFHSSRDSNLSADISKTTTPHKSTSTKSYNNNNNSPTNILVESQAELETHLKEIIEIQMRQHNNHNSKPSGNEQNLTVPYSEVPLIDALQHRKSILVQESPGLQNAVACNRLNGNSSGNGGLESCEVVPRNEFSRHDSRGDDILTCIHQDTQDLRQRSLRSASTQQVSRSVQVWPTPPYRLRVLPRPMSSCNGKQSVLGYIGRCIFCQVGLAVLLVVWALAGAGAFYYTEGPAEVQMVAEQKALVHNLVNELMQAPREDEALWHRTVERYVYRHEIAWSDGNADISTRSPGRVWSLPGCTLFAISLITTLGFGAPVPRTSEGRAVAVVFAAVGIPLHLILVLNIGMVIAVKLQKIATRNAKNDTENPEESEEIQKSDHFTDITKNNGLVNRHRRTGSEPIGRQAISNITREAGFIMGDKKEHKYRHISETDGKVEDKDFIPNINNFLPGKKQESSFDICAFKSLENLSKEERKIYKEIGCQPNKMPIWLKWLPFIGIAIYYTSGVLMFGFGRSQGFLDSMMFPLDFTVAGGVAHTAGYIRVLYGIYLEGAVVLAATTVSILQVTATKGFTDLGLRFGLLTNSR